MAKNDGEVIVLTVDYKTASALWLALKLAPESLSAAITLAREEAKADESKMKEAVEKMAAYTEAMYLLEEPEKQLKDAIEKYNSQQD